MARVLIYYFILFFLYGCIVSRGNKNAFKKNNLCNDEVFLNNKEPKIELQGYYYFQFESTITSNLKSEKNTIVNNFDYVFYPNGMCIANLFKLNRNTIKKDEYRYGYIWGIYKIENDTIKAIFIDPPNLSSNCIYFDNFKIISKKQIKLLASTLDRPITKDDYIKYEEKAKLEKRSLGNFIQNDILPDPNNSWLIKKRWFWCDKQKYKEWKKKNK